MKECVFKYRTYHILFHGSVQFLLSEIERQLVKTPLAIAISSYSHLPTRPMHEMYDETRDRPPPGTTCLTLFNKCVGSLMSLC